MTPIFPSDWLAVECDVQIPSLDWAETPLHIKATKSVISSYSNHLFFSTYDINGEYVGTVGLRKKQSSIHYYMTACTGWGANNATNYKELPVQATEQYGGIWVFSKNNTTLSIAYNRVELIVYSLSESQNKTCLSYWKDVKTVTIARVDTVSSQYCITDTCFFQGEGPSYL